MSPRRWSTNPGIGRFATGNATAIMFITLALCLGGVFAALRMPSSVFPQTNFPRCVILIDNGVMPADEMMATITRPIEEAMKDVPGAAFVNPQHPSGEQCYQRPQRLRCRSAQD
jgi:multidrug efflux pump subunit AcrB